MKLTINCKLSYELVTPVSVMLVLFLQVLTRKFSLVIQLIYLTQYLHYLNLYQIELQTMLKFFEFLHLKEIYKHKLI